MLKSKEWFTERIGKRVYADKTICDCDFCQEVKEHGMEVKDELYADYLHLVSKEIGIDFHDN